jgi:hypothetical protein
VLHLAQPDWACIGLLGRDALFGVQLLRGIIRPASRVYLPRTDLQLCSHSWTFASQPVCNDDWALDLTGTHCEVGLLTGTNDLLQTWLAAAENWAESDDHREIPRVAQDDWTDFWGWRGGRMGWDNRSLDHTVGSHSDQTIRLPRSRRPEEPFVRP